MTGTTGRGIDLQRPQGQDRHGRRHDFSDTALHKVVRILLDCIVAWSVNEQARYAGGLGIGQQLKVLHEGRPIIRDIERVLYLIKKFLELFFRRRLLETIGPLQRVPGREYRLQKRYKKQIRSAGKIFTRQIDINNVRSEEHTSEL